MERETNVLAVVTLILVLVGILMAYSTSAVDLESKRFATHVRYAAAGFIIMCLVAHLDYHVLGHPWIYRPLFILALGLLVLIFAPGFGVEEYGATRWIRLLGVRFQPSEFAKLALIVILAAKLTENRDRLDRLWGGFLPPLGIAAAFAVLVAAENDLGVPATMMVVAIIMMFVAGARVRHLALSFGVLTIGIGALIFAKGHRPERMLAFLFRWELKDKAAFQLIQSLSAFARGGLWGVGPGAGEQKLDYLPAAHNDFIFAVWGEEMGFIGSVALVLLYVGLLAVALRVARNAPDLFGSFLAAGIIALITFQTTFVMGMTTGLLPTKGLPLPFVSYGGTALVMSLVLMGVLLSVARQARPDTDGASCPALT
ncbi:MAG TPA: putative peptidoglycan glycosyltransferase FtsW [Candidatus Hydrogenedentes bacterium]|nr:putative peptidoglycan glycosyltransferase FtsW [Candidatus Hydrogenedentota bacterium]HPG68086.1 putative peptidoglycan glycosyltransferase FtsW [Candidatus Hydrogenedentota bacterium]